MDKLAFSFRVDATNEYVGGHESESCSGIHSCGLQCVTVLIGVFDKTTSQPIMGELGTNTCNYTHTLPVIVYTYYVCLYVILCMYLFVYVT